MIKGYLQATTALAMCAALAAHPARAQQTQFERDLAVARHVINSLLSFHRTNETTLYRQKLRRDGLLDFEEPYKAPFTEFEEELIVYQGKRADRIQALSASTRQTIIDLDFRAYICMEEGDAGLHPEITKPLPYNGTRYTLVGFFADETTRVSTGELYDFARSGQAKITGAMPHHQLIKIDWWSGRYHDAKTDTWHALSDCLKYIAPLFPKDSVGFISKGRRVSEFNKLNFTERYVEEAPVACPPPEFPNKTIGQQIRRYKTFKLTDVSPSDPMLDHRGNNVGQTLGELETKASRYYQGCRAPHYSRTGAFRETCGRTIKGQFYPDKGVRVWDVDLLEEAPARGYYLAGESRNYKPVDGTWSLRMQLCDSDTAPSSPAFTTTEQSAYSSGSQACSAVYGSSYPDGTQSLRRTKQTTTVTYTNVLPPSSREVMSYGDWQVLSNPCSKTTLSGLKTRERGSASRSCMIEAQTYQIATTSYADGRTSSSSETNQSGWSLARNTCPPPTPKPRNNPKTYFDVDGDGKGDFRTWDEAYRYHKNHGGPIPVSIEGGGCETAGCNGPEKDTDRTNKKRDRSRGGGGSPKGKGDSDKIVCTAMNAAYGFGSYRQAIWLTHAAQNLTRYHQTGYHMMALPLIRVAYRSDTHIARALRATLEHMARERTADIRAEMRGAARRPLGRLYRAILEPLSYGLGWLAGGRDIEGIDEVPILARQIKAFAQSQASPLDTKLPPHTTPSKPIQKGAA